MELKATIEVQYLDGQTESVTVRVLPMRKMERYLEALQNEAACVELFCDKPQGWADTICPESYGAIADKGQALNLPIFQNWYRRLVARSEAMNPGLLERAQKEALAQMTVPNAGQEEGAQQ